jgi:hypothetical protein
VFGLHLVFVADGSTLLGHNDDEVLYLNKNSKNGVNK